MPKGVEHSGADPEKYPFGDVINSVMPKGVEHDPREHGFSCGAGD